MAAIKFFRAKRKKKTCELYLHGKEGSLVDIDIIQHLQYLILGADSSGVAADDDSSCNNGDLIRIFGSGFAPSPSFSFPFSFSELFVFNTNFSLLWSFSSFASVSSDACLAFLSLLPVERGGFWIASGFEGDGSSDLGVLSFVEEACLDFLELPVVGASAGWEGDVVVVCKRSLISQNFSFNSFYGLKNTHT